MNFDAIDKLSNMRVIDLLDNIPDSSATKQYLLITRYILDSILEKKITILERVYKIWYSTFFLRIWRYWIKLRKYGMQNNCITLNTYTCIELNAHNLLIIIEKCREKNEIDIFLPWLFSSQPCEKIFRQTRSMTSTFSTMVNYSLLDIMKRLNRIQAINEISTDLGKLVFRG